MFGRQAHVVRRDANHDGTLQYRCFISPVVGRILLVVAPIFLDTLTYISFSHLSHASLLMGVCRVKTCLVVEDDIHFQSMAAYEESTVLSILIMVFNIIDIDEDQLQRLGQSFSSGQKKSPRRVMRRGLFFCRSISFF